MRHKFETEEYAGPIGWFSRYNSDDFESGGVYEEFANKFSKLSLEELLEVAMQSVHEVCFLPHGWFGAKICVTFKVLSKDEEHLFYGDGKDFYEALFVALAALNVTNCVYTKKEFNEKLEDIRRQLSEVQNDPNLTIVTHHDLLAA